MRRRSLLLAVTMAALAACHSAPASPSTPASPGHAPMVTAPSPSIDPNFDNGQEILITKHAFVPHWLVSIVNHDIVWVNQTSKPQRIRFDNGTVDSGPIAPGKTFSYKPTDSVSIPYGSVDDPKMTGVIQVEPFLDPGETPFTSPPASP